MRRKTFISLGLVSLLMLCAAPVYANGIPALPNAFHGTVTINNSSAPVGTRVEARGTGVTTDIPQNPVTTTVVGQYGTGGLYLLVQGDILDGATITFYVNGVSTGQTAAWHSDETTQLTIDLVSDITAQKVETVPAGVTDYVIDFSTLAGTTITVDTIGEVTITVQKYAENPHPGVALPANMLAIFIDISVDNPAAVDWPMRVEYTYTDAEVVGLNESTLAMYYYKAAAWHECSDTGVNTATNTIWANMLRDELSGSPITFGEAVAPTPAVGGGGGAPAAMVTLSLTGLAATPSLVVDSGGNVQSTCQLKTTDGKSTLDIAAGTRLLDSVGNRLAFVLAGPQPSPPAVPSGEAIITAYDLAPSGATFSPAITLTINYDPASLPEDVAEQDLYIAFWDGSEWNSLATTVDTEANTVSCALSHFTTFAVIGAVAPPPPPPPAPAAFSVSSLSIQPEEAEPLEVVTITVSVANTGGTEGSYSVVLDINGVKEAEKSVTVAAGGSQSVSFSVTREEAASYSVAVDGLSGSFTVVAPEVVPPEVKPINWPLIGGIIGGVVIAGLLIFFWMRRRAY